MSKSYLFNVFLSTLLIGFPCLSQQMPDTRLSDEQAIRAADAAWIKAVQANDLDNIVSVYAEDACEFPIEEPITCGKEAIRENWAHMLGIPGIRLTWQIVKVEVSRSGDLAYVQSNYQASFEGVERKTAIERGKAVTVWKKQRDGAWRAVADISNTDSPPPEHKPSRSLSVPE